MGYIFRTGLHACDSSGTVVFLDLPADRYFALSGRANESCRRLIAGSAEANDAAVIDALVADSILVSVPEMVAPSLCQPGMSVRRWLDAATASPFRGRTILATMRHTFAIAELKVRRLDSIIQILRRQKRQMRASPPRASISAADIGAAFLSADRLLSPNGRCLARSIALAREMIAHGIEPELTLGVKLRPFEAHCWVQHGEFLVSDDIGTIVPFTPILTL